MSPVLAAEGDAPPDAGPPGKSASPSRASDGAAPAGRELNLVPLVGGDSDIGAGVGWVGDWAHLQPGAGIFRWRLESGAFISFMLRGGTIIVPFQDYYLLLTQRNRGAEKRWKVDVRASFTDETTLKYYGIGDASPLPPAGLDVRQTEYRRIHPTLSAEGQLAVARHVFLVLGNFYTHNWLAVPAGGTLEGDRVAGPPDVQALLGGFGAHGVELAEVGLEYDSRDNEIVTRHGMFHALKLRYSPRVESWLPYAYGQIDLTLRGYTTPIPRWLTLSARLVGDALLGSPPFYELARFDETPAIGGVNAVRGVPAQRYYGKVKVFGNLEARSEVYPFHVGSKPLVLGVAAFLDAGRVWTELGRSHPALDGTGLGLKYGIGGGLRLQQGQTFLVRVDVAWSPDASPVGAYFAAGQIF